MTQFQVIKCKVCGNPNVNLDFDMLCSFRCSAKDQKWLYLTTGIIISVIGAVIEILLFVFERIQALYVLTVLLIIIGGGILIYIGIYGAKVTIEEWQQPKLDEQIKNKTRIALQKEISVCCIETAVFQNFFCSCGRVVPQTLLDQYK